MKDIEREGNVPITLRKTVVFGIALLFVISSAMAIENVNSTTDIDENELEVRSGFYGLSGGTWWNSSFEYRKLITINHSQVDATLSNFPVLVYRNTDGDLSSHAQTDGDDIAFVLYSDNSTKLNHEIENYSNGTLWTWVNVMSLSSSIDTKIWMYYGNDTCSSQESIGGVWNSGYNAVYHMNDIASNDKIEDSTENSYDSIETKRTPDYEQTGKISTAVYYFDREAHIIPDDVLAENPTDFTVSCWINFHSFAEDKQHLIALLENTNIKLLAENIDDDDVYKAALIVRNGGDNKAYGTITLNTDTWYYLIGTYNGENITIYTNGDDAQSTACTSIKHEGKGNQVGAKDKEKDNAYGDIDEVRISKTERSEGWISTCFVNQNDSSSFYSVGSEETPGSTRFITNLESGWNFVSLPFNQSVNKTDLTVIYNNSDYSWQEAVNNSIILGFIYNWNRTNQKYETTDILKPGEGHWMYAYDDCELRVYGIGNIVTDSYITDLLTSWNIVGVPDDVAVEKENITIRYNGTNYTWQEAVNNSIILGFIYGWNETIQSYGVSDVLNPGKSYWMYAYQDCRLLRPLS